MAPILPSFVAIATSLFVAELTDKDALLLLALATRTRALLVFLAGTVAFLFTTTVIVSVGTLAVSVVPVFWIKLVGGIVMLSYGVWQAKGAFGTKEVEEEERLIERSRGAIRTFLLMVGGLALLDLAGDATEVLTIVFVAQYSNLVLVFTATITGLIGATAVETALGNRLGLFLTPRRMKYLSMAIFTLIGCLILVTTVLTA